MKKHWAYPFIGKPWAPDYNCWTLVQEVFLTRYGINMPHIGVGELQAADQVAPIKRAARRSGWRPVTGEPADGDIVLGYDAIGKRHVGVMIEVTGKLRLLHNDGHMTERGPTGSVVAQPLADAIEGGFKELELWRRA